MAPGLLVFVISLISAVVPFFLGTHKCLSVSRAVRGSLGLTLARAAWRSEDGVAPLPRPSSLLEPMKTP